MPPVWPTGVPGDMAWNAMKQNNACFAASLSVRRRLRGRCSPAPVAFPVFLTPESTDIQVKKGLKPTIYLRKQL